MKKLRGLALAFYAFWLFAGIVGPALSAEQKSSEASFVFTVIKELQDNYYAPENLNPPDLLNAALDGVSQALKAKGVNYSFEKIKSESEFLAEFQKAENLVKNKKLSEHFLAFSAAHELLKSVGDSHTYFLDPEAVKKINEYFSEKKYVGIGVALGQLEEGLVYVDQVFSGSPAQKAGLKRFDQLVSVNSFRITKKTKIAEIVRRVKGKQGTQVTIGFLRNKKKRQVSITRDKVTPFSLQSEILKREDYKITYIKMAHFNFPAATELYSVLQDFDVSGAKGIILDLRGNPGGLLMVLNWVLDFFLPSETPAYILKSRGKIENVSSGNRLVLLKRPKAPMAVLLNKYSASASEILAAILQENGIAVIIGEKSAGMVSVGRSIGLPYGAEMKVTINEFLTAKGKKLEGVGVQPDIIAPFSREGILRGKDSQLEKALEVLKGKLN